MLKILKRWLEIRRLRRTLKHIDECISSEKMALNFGPAFNRLLGHVGEESLDKAETEQDAEKSREGLTYLQNWRNQVRSRLIELGHQVIR